MSVITFNDAYTDKPMTTRDALMERIRALKAQHWADPSDRELRERIAALEAELAALDHAGSAA